MNEINVPLMRKTLEYIDEHPEEHNQNVWVDEDSCGTVRCFADGFDSRPRLPGPWYPTRCVRADYLTCI